MLSRLVCKQQKKGDAIYYKRLVMQVGKTYAMAAATYGWAREGMLGSGLLEWTG